MFWIHSASLPAAAAATAVVVLAFLQQGLLVDGTRIKVHLSPDVGRLGLVSRQVPPESACIDVQVISEPNLPQDILSNLNERVRYYSSVQAKDYIDTSIFTRSVTGLDGKTVRDVFNVLLSEGCYPFFYGGLVRDQFLGRQPGDVDVEANCDIYTVYSVCITTWGEKNCKINNVTLRAHIGQEESSPDDLIDVASTDATFFAPLSELEYTVNSMAYDLNDANNVIVDIPGNGVIDVCNKSIRIPSDDGSETSWDQWRMVDSGISKLYRFWKLRTKDLTPINTMTLEYVVRYTMMAIESDPNSFRKFYCNTVYGSGNYNSQTMMCEVPKETCLNEQSKANKYKQYFFEDFGEAYYNGTLVAVIKTTCDGCASLLSSLVLVAMGVVLSFGI